MSSSPVPRIGSASRRCGRVPRWRVAAAAAVVVLGGVVALPTSAVGEPAKVAVPSQGELKGYIDLGPASEDQTLSAQVFLGANAARLRRFATAVSDPESASYRRFLSGRETRRRFEISPADQRRVSRWLRSSGLSILSSDRHQITVRAAVKSLATAFGTSISVFKYDEPDPTGRLYRPTSAVKVPASLAPSIVAVELRDPPFTYPDVSTQRADRGLNRWGDGRSTHARSMARTRPTRQNRAMSGATSAGPVSPCPKYFGTTPATELPKPYGATTTWAPCGYTPRQLRGLYGTEGIGRAGSGVTVAVIGTETNDALEHDLDEAARLHNEPRLRRGQVVRHVSSDAVQAFYDFETSQDTQAVHAMAPYARIDYVVGSQHDNSDLFVNSFFDIVDRNEDDVVTASLIGASETDVVNPSSIMVYDTVLQLAAVQGISVNVASGDTSRDVAQPSNSPWLTTVGGTTPAIGPGGKKLWETPWVGYTSELTEDGSWDPALPGVNGGSSTGGRSMVIPQPAYQRGHVPTDLAGKPAMRTIPDVAADADNQLGLQYVLSGYVTDPAKDRYTSRLVGNGTSLASPLFAGWEAAVVQRAGGRLGAANAALYARSRLFGRISGNSLSGSNTKSFAGTGDNSFAGFIRWQSKIQDPVTILGTPGLSQNFGQAYGPGYSLVTGLGTPTKELLASFGKR